MMLSDEEKQEIWNEVAADGGTVFDAIDAIERAVLAKASQQVAAIPEKQYDINLIHRAARHLESVMNDHQYCDHVQVVKNFADIRLRERSLSASPKPEMVRITNEDADK